MLKRLTVALVVMLVLMVALDSQHRIVLSSVLNESDVMVLGETTDGETQDLEAPKKKGGNGFVKVVTFPFKAVGRLFGGGKKDENKLERLSKKDAEKFESAKFTRVVDARTGPSSEPAQPTTDKLTGSINLDSLDAVELKKAQAREHLQRGRELFNAKDLNGAVNSLSMAVSLDRGLWDAHNLLGIAYEIKGYRGKALEYLAAALNGKNDQPEHLNDFGYVLMNNGEYSRAVKYLKRAVKARPSDQRFLNNLGMALVQIGKFDEAYKHFETAMGEFNGRMNMATRLVRLGHDKEAIKHLERCRVIQPNNQDVLYPLTVLYARYGRTEDAADANKALISIRTSAAATPQ